MARGRVEGEDAAPAAELDLARHAEELRSRFLGGMSRLAAQAQRSARRVKDAAHDLRSSPAVQHAVAARDRGNLEAAFWLLNEAFTHDPDEPDVALHYWDVALSLGRIDIASQAGVRLIEDRAAGGAPELAAQHWLELVKEAPDVLVSPAAIATLLPALKQRMAEPVEGADDDPETLGGYLRRAVRHAVDPRNTGLHPGVALRIFEEGREINPEAARRAAEAALESPNLHEAKRQRLVDWLGGKSEVPREAGRESRPHDSARPQRPASGEPPRRAQKAANPASDDEGSGLSADEIQRAAARLPESKPVSQPEPDTGPGAEAGADPEPDAETSSPAETSPEITDATDLRVTPGVLRGVDDEGLEVEGVDGAIPWAAVQAVAVAEVMGLEEDPVTIVDLISNWTRRETEPLEVVRLRVDELELERLVTRKHALGSDFAALMGDIMERTSAIPLPDPESALGTRITCFENPDLYRRVALRIQS